MNLCLLLGNRARVLCMGPVSRLLPLAARFPSLLPGDLKNISELSTQEGSPGHSRHSLAGTPRSTGVRLLLLCCPLLLNARPQGVCWQGVGVGDR